MSGGKFSVSRFVVFNPFFLINMFQMSLRRFSLITTFFGEIWEWIQWHDSAREGSTGMLNFIKEDSVWAIINSKMNTNTTLKITTWCYESLTRTSVRSLLRSRRRKKVTNWDHLHILRTFRLKTLCCRKKMIAYILCFFIDCEAVWQYNLLTP